MKKALFITSAYLILYTAYLIPGIALAQSVLPSITIHSPVDGQEYNDEVVEFKVSVKDFTFVDFKNNTVLYPNDPNAGHAHVWIESRFTGAGDNLAYKLLSADFHEVGELSPGNYRLTVELVRNDDSQFDPRISNTVTFSVGRDGIQTGRYSVKNRPEPGVEISPPRKAGVSERSLALIIILVILAALYVIFRKKLERYTFFKKLNILLAKIYIVIKHTLIRIKRKITKNTD